MTLQLRSSATILNPILSAILLVLTISVSHNSIAQKRQVASSKLYRSEVNTMLNVDSQNQRLDFFRKLKSDVDKRLPINANAPLYSPCNFFIVYKQPDFYSIKYNSSYDSNSNLERYRKSINSLEASHEYQSKLSTNNYTLNGIRKRITIEKPSMTSYTWSEIPEPDKVIREGRGLRKSQTEREIAKLFNEQRELNAQVAKPKVNVSPWTFSGTENIQLSQMFLSNWAKGGESTITLSSDLRFSAIYSQKNVEWENSGTHKLGVTNTSVLGTRVSDDVLDLSSKFGYKASNSWYYSAKNTFKTQFFKSYSKSDTKKENPLSGFMSPAYIQFIFGMDLKKTDFSLLLSPYTCIITMVVDTNNVEKKLIPKSGICDVINGLSVTCNWKKNFTREIAYTTQLELFYEYLEKDGQKRFDWENILDLRVNRFLTTRFLIELRYYENESNKFQVKQNFNIAFKYTF